MTPRTIPANRAQAAPVRAVTGFAVLLAAMGWAAILTQMVLSVSRAAADGRGVVSGRVNSFSYFTILTNLLVAVTLTSQAAAPGSRIARFLGRPGVLTAIAAYIAVVGVAYHVLLADLYHPTGIARVTDTVFHYAMPLLFLGYWWLAVPGGQLPGMGPPAWAAYPLAYFVYLLARGAVTGVYPYPFADPSQLGYPRAVLNGLGILGSILFTGAVLTAAKRVKAERPTMVVAAFCFLSVAACNEQEVAQKVGETAENLKGTGLPWVEVVSGGAIALASLFGYKRVRLWNEAARYPHTDFTDPEIDEIEAKLIERGWVKPPKV